jgi:putative DNA primase/helicase
VGEAALILPVLPISLHDRLTAHTLPFLAGLLDCTFQEAWQRPLAFQVFDDLEGRRDPKLAKAWFGSLAGLAHELEQRNQAGAGIFLAVNGTDGVGRSKANIQELRAWWADLDEKAATSAFRTEQLPLAPSLVVRSGHGTHLYWRTREPYGCAGNRERLLAHEAELRRIRAALTTYGADPAVCEAARVMRLPGFWNRKREPHRLVELGLSRPVQYTPEELRAAFPALPDARGSSPLLGTALRSTDEKIRRAHAYARKLAEQAPAIAGRNGHRTTFQAALKIACGFDLGEEEAFQVLWDAFNPVCQPPWSQEELRRKVQEAIRNGTNRGWLLGPGPLSPASCLERSQDPPPRAQEVAEDPPPTQAPSSPCEDPTRPCFPPFRLDTEGLWYLPPGKAAEDGSVGTPNPVKLCGPFQVLAEARDAHGCAWGLRLRWQDGDGQTHEETIPRELALGEGAELARILVRRGLQVAPDDAKRKKLVAYLASVRVPGRARSVERVGWHGATFLLPDAAFGEMPGGERVHLALDLEHAFRVNGTLADWQREVGRHAQGNSRLTFALACAFAAPMLERLGMESGGFHFCGRSSKGKTTCIEAAGSVWGGPVYRETWRATANGLEAVALAHCDCLLILDEQGQALPREAGEVAYLLANGMDKVRARKTLDSRPRRRWQTLFLSTGEVTLADKMREEGRTPKAGQDVRMVDIPVTPEGQDQAFETWDGFESSKALADHLRRATRRSYGTAIRAFLDCLGRKQAQDLLDVEQRKVAWARQHLPRGADSQVGRVVDRFALAALAGELAAEWGIVPWRPGNAEWAAEVCLQAWLAQRGGIGAGEQERGLAAVLGFIERHGSSRFADWDNQGERVSNCAGFRRRDGEGRLDYLFHSEGWTDACEGLVPKDVARACAEAGLLDSLMEAGKLRFQKNVKVPGRGTERFYFITGRGLEAYRQRQAELA